jgi:uracil-DNA glycosylase
MEKQWLEQTFTQSWYNRLKHYLESDEFKKLGKKIGEARKVSPIYPQSSEVFRAFQCTPFNEVRVVILGLSPYFTKGTADGLAFSSKQANTLGNKMPPSLVNVLGAVENDIYRGLMLDKNADLERWAKQGVLLLNCALTTPEGNADAHLPLWKNFTKEVLTALNEYNTGIVYCLWGSKAKEYKKYIKPKYNYILECSHPASAAYNNCVWNCNHFSEINKILKQNNNEEIIW